MLNTPDRRHGQALRLFAGCTLVLAVGAGESASQPAPFGAAGPPSRVTTEAHGQAPEQYTPQEAEAVAIVEQWIDAWVTYDLVRLVSLMEEDVVFRADPVEDLQYGRRNFCLIAAAVINGWSGLDLQELYVVGGEQDTSVLIRRVDYFPPGGRGLAGQAIDVATFLRVQNGRITEWLDAPTIPVGPGAMVAQGAPRPEFPVQPEAVEACSFLDDPAWEPQPNVEAPETAYATRKPEGVWSEAERDAAQAVRAWVHAMSTGDPADRAQFMDEDVAWRADPSQPLQRGRDGFVETLSNTGDGASGRLLELYVVGGDWDTSVLALRVDDGDAPVAVFFRVQDGLIVEWLDAPAGPGAAAPGP